MSVIEDNGGSSVMVVNEPGNCLERSSLKAKTDFNSLNLSLALALALRSYFLALVLGLSGLCLEFVFLALNALALA